MRFARKLTLLALAAIAAMAFAVAPASARDPVFVVNEKTATTCSDVVSPHTSGGCVVHASGTVKLEVWIFTWITERTCDIELEMRVGGDGTGAVDDLDHYSTEAGADSDCATNPPVVACDLPWEGGTEEDGIHRVETNLTSCIDPGEGDVCGDTLSYDITESEAAETYSVVINHVLGLCRISGTLGIESSVTGNAALHLVH